MYPKKYGNQQNDTEEKERAQEMKKSDIQTFIEWRWNFFQLVLLSSLIRRHNRSRCCRCRRRCRHRHHRMHDKLSRRNESEVFSYNKIKWFTNKFKTNTNIMNLYKSIFSLFCLINRRTSHFIAIQIIRNVKKFFFLCRITNHADLPVNRWMCVLQL